MTFLTGASLAARSHAQISTSLTTARMCRGPSPTHTAAQKAAHVWTGSRPPPVPATVSLCARLYNLRLAPCCRRHSHGLTAVWCVQTDGVAWIVRLTPPPAPTTPTPLEQTSARTPRRPRIRAPTSRVARMWVTLAGRRTTTRTRAPIPPTRQRPAHTAAAATFKTVTLPRRTRSTAVSFPLQTHRCNVRRGC